MSRHAQIEEVEDDPDHFDITEYDPRSAQRNAAASIPFMDPAEIANQFQAHGNPQMQFVKESNSAAFKGYQVIYPIYFDLTRSREQGRRVNKEYAVNNPLAREIVDCCNLNGLKTVFEPTKTHPKDWANPGRVRVLLKEDGQPQHGKIKNKRHLMQIVGSYLKAHPSNERTPLRLRFPQMPHQDKPAPLPSVPRGWKLNSILPLHSPALTGGGVSDNILKDMMSEIGGAGGLPAGMPNLGALQSMFDGMGGGLLSPAEGSSAGDGRKKEKK
ncbi:signal recognition particle protein, partial [Terfezia boudieri ATCC MYA-4762]